MGELEGRADSEPTYRRRNGLSSNWSSFVFDPCGAELKLMLECDYTYGMKPDAQTLKYLENLIDKDVRQV
jgi:hypothetical protein